MKFLILATLITTTAFAQLSTSVAVTSDYVWRGQSQTGTAAAVQGTAEYAFNNITVGTWVSSFGGSDDNGTTTTVGGAEVDFYASYTHSFSENCSVALSVNNYTYTKNTAANSLEYGVTLATGYADLFVGTMDEYFGADTSSMYYNLSKAFTLNESKKLGLSVAVGMTSFDKEAVAGMKDYMDYKLALTKTKGDMEYELFFTETDRKDNADVDQKDSTFGVMLTHSL